ncbi:hypothetical protein HELRODRAFT_127248, partial [Helobdella robusta]|uniref:Protein kinase domain-containing protein n=1 Tax=Helobdella robusta TaxID=6412 RepID=T1EHD4_HELRO
KHPFIVSMYDCMQNNNQVFFIMEYIPGGSLKEHLIKCVMFNELETAFYSGCALLAINHLHSLDIAHRDIKLENFILDCCGYAKLVDFDL